MLKRCRTCNFEKETSEFYKQTNGNLRAGCKTCAKQKVKTKYQLNPKLQINRVMESFRKKSDYYNSKSERFSSQGKRFFCSFAIKPVILKRDNYCCQLCSITSRLQLHHIIPVRYDIKDENIFNPKNLVILCKACHLKAHKGNYKNLDSSLALDLIEHSKNRERLCETKLPKFRELICSGSCSH